MKFLPSLWIVPDYQPHQRRVQSGLLSRLMILSCWFKRLSPNNYRLTRVMTPLLPVELKNSGYQTALINSAFPITSPISPLHPILSNNFTQNIYPIPSGLNTS